MLSARFERIDLSSQLKSSGTTRSGLPRFLVPAAWISCVLNVVIIATGGAVRLTGSGLGCSEWPLCTPGSLTPTAETGIHGIIEFANRTLSGPVLLAAVVVLVLTWRIRSQRKDLFGLSIAVTGLVIIQALVGAFVVWESLATVLVGFHYSVSIVIVCTTAAYLVRMTEPAGPRIPAVPKVFWAIAAIAALGIVIIVITGVFTTAAGPHSGDADVVRDGFDATVLSHLHAWPGYITGIMCLVLLVWAKASNLQPYRSLLGLVVLLMIQIAVGVYQARSGLPPIAVGVHMVLAALVAAMTSVMVLRLKEPAQKLTPKNELVIEQTPAEA
ncbi:COX15/CtaA family protein [Yaniella flava]|uniref:COX15/CtaA family protein n=1 Tax=Yaniella flava TaxID=287930 RepID=UPI0031DC24E9